MKYSKISTLLLLLILGNLHGCFFWATYDGPCNDYCPCTDGKISASNIVRWNGTQWLPLGSGVNGEIRQIVIDSSTNELYVFGYFTTAGGIPVNGVAKWNENLQSWSDVGTHIPTTSQSGFDYKRKIFAFGGKMYICNKSPEKLYNVDGSFVDKNGLYVWEDNNWKMLLNIIEGKYQIIPPDIAGGIGNTLYFTSQSYKDEFDKNNKLYWFDLLTNKITDSLPDSLMNSGYSKDFIGKILISHQGIIIDEGNGVYRYFEGNRKKIIPTITGREYTYSLLTSSSEYVSLWNYYTTSLKSSVKSMIVYDVNADTIMNEPVIPLDPAHLTQQVYSTKISGHTLFIGGAYYLKDSSTDVRNIGAYDLRDKKWYDLAGGVCGPVNAIAEMNGSIYVGGNFSTAGKK